MPLIMLIIASLMTGCASYRSDGEFSGPGNLKTSEFSGPKFSMPKFLGPGEETKPSRVLTLKSRSISPPPDNQFSINWPLNHIHQTARD